MQIAIYHRVSTTDQDPTIARTELRTFAVARGYAIALEVEETGSGARNDRPGLARVMEAARKGKVEAVLVWKLDRFGRSALDLLANMRALEDAGVRFIAATQGIDVKPGGDPMSKLLVTMLAAVAEFERDLIVERTRLGIAKARSEGRSFGRPRRTPAPAAADVARLRAGGMSWRAIGVKLGVPEWSARRAAKGSAISPVENIT